ARRLLRCCTVAGAQRDFGTRVDEGAADVVSDTAGPPGDEGDLSGQIELHAIPALHRGVYFRPSSHCHAASMNLVTSSAVPRLTTFASGTIRFKRPASTEPGPISTQRASEARARASTSIFDGLGGGVGDHGKLGIGKLRALERDLE